MLIILFLKWSIICLPIICKNPARTIKSGDSSFKVKKSFSWNFALSSKLLTSIIFVFNPASFAISTAFAWLFEEITHSILAFLISSFLNALINAFKFVPVPDTKTTIFFN